MENRPKKNNSRKTTASKSKRATGASGVKKASSTGSKSGFKNKYSKEASATRTSRTGNLVSNSTPKKAPLPTFSDHVRLNKYLANAGLCSRREADELITAGVVEVNGVVVTEMGYKVAPGDLVKYGGGTVKQEKTRYLILNKPKDYTATNSDLTNKKNVLHLVMGACREQISSVGTLERETTGLLMFTNDYDLAKKLTHPSSNIKKLYHLTLDKPVKTEHLQALRDGIELHDGVAKVDSADYVNSAEDKRELGIEIRSGKTKLVTRMLEYFDYKIIKLDRVIFAGITKKDLPRGKWRFLTEQEVAFLKMM